MINPVSAVQLTASTVVILHGAWWTALSLLALPAPRRRAAAQPSQLSTTVVVPAHNEERLISATLQSLFSANRSEPPEVIVVADNCTDATAELARALGATVLERQDASQRGKPFALAFALNVLSQRASPPDILVVIDADTTVSQNFFEAIEARIACGARAVQAHYAAGPAETDLGRLRRLAFSLVHWARPLGASRLGLGTTLKGNGMAFAWEVAALGLSGTSVTEDAESTLALARQGVTVEFEPLASVHGYMAQTYAEARTQDARWEGGRAGLMLKAIITAVSSAGHGHLRPIAGSLEVASLPLSLLALIALGAVVPAVAGYGSVPLAAAATFSLGAYVAIGLIAARASRRDLQALAAAPRFVMHKIGVYASLGSRRSARGWQRTGRG